MTAGPLRHFVIAIYGVGNPAPGDVQRSVESTLNAAAAGLPVEVHEFDWNAVAVHAPRAAGRLVKYTGYFSRSFASAAWHRPVSPGISERVRAVIDGVAHGAWAATQSLFVVFLITAIVLFLIGAASQALSGFVRPFVAIGLIPPGVGWRGSALSGYGFELAALVLRYGGLLTLVCILASLALAFLEALFARSMRPVAVTARRHVLILLLVPCALLSLSFVNEKDESELGKSLIGFSVLAMAGLVMVSVISLFLGGFRSSMTWAMLPMAAGIAVLGFGILMRLVRGRVGRAWLGPAKVLLDIALYAGTPAYRAAIQEHLSLVIAAIPDRATTAIWVVAHSLGSVIALDSLTNSSAWQPGDRVRLVTLGSPIRRFFFRFFPGAYFEPRIDAAACTIAARVGEFTWLNAFRRFDYVGTSLGLRGYGFDLPTRQYWPCHANYWGDGCVARTVLDGLPESRSVIVNAPPQAESTATTSGVPVGLVKACRIAGLTIAGSVLVVAVAGAWWMLFPGFREMAVRPPLEVRTPVSTTARVRHERGFFDEAPMHQFRFEFRDQAGRERHISAWVPGFFRVWSDARFDYLALTRFVRAKCTPERTQRFYEFGWSVPCVRDDVPITYDPENPSRFLVVGLEYRPGYIARGVKALMTLVVILMGIACALPSVVLVPALWGRLWGIFVGDPAMLPRAFGNADE